MENLIGSNALRELFDYLFFFSTIMLVPFAAFVALFQVACVIWSPFAALICAVIARKTGLSVWKYALAGAIGSTLLFVPWIFLIQRMRNKRISYDEVVKPIYMGLYAIWGTVIFGNIVVHITLMGMAKLLPTWLGGGASYEGAGPMLFWKLLDQIIVPTVIGMPILIPSLIGFVRRLRSEDTEMTHVKSNILFQPVYLAPFLGTSATIVSILWLNWGFVL
ncbi:MAG: hypothetical protein OXI16_00635 [Chloroflexota bacterium]|nr:hypothetical protein [Chloroflexota bacterium]